MVLVSPAGPERDDLFARLSAAGALVMVQSDGQDLGGQIGKGGPDVFVVDELLGDAAWDVLGALGGFNVGRVFLMRSRDTEQAARAIRLGVHDIIAGDAKPDTADILRAAAFARAAGERARGRARSRLRLARTVDQLREGHTQLLRQVGDLAAGVGGTCRTLADQMERVALGAEFNAVIRQELELEGLLRTTLEYVLKKAGSTNAAIFLPSSSGDYTLGAYINFDLAKDTAETLLGQLADELAPACECHRELTMITTADELGVSSVGEDHWLGESTFAVRACWSDSECIAVLAIFRDRRHPFPEAVRPALGVVTDLFGAQLSRVIKTHYRSKPKEEWGANDAAAA